jgi:drug/metabolite transporter (DMT)-like permease
MNQPEERSTPSLRTNLLVISGCVVFLVLYTIIQRIVGQEPTGKGNSTLFAVGLGALGISVVALWARHRLELKTWDIVLIIFQGGVGIIALGMVNYSLLGETGIVVTVPFVVPIVLALLRKR